MKMSFGRLRSLIGEALSEMHLPVQDMSGDTFMPDEISYNEPCGYCGSDNTEQLNGGEPIPSMTGSGEEGGVHCLDCGKDTWHGPEIPPAPLNRRPRY